jgi:magnesium-transporting ATPase (P-type)
LPSELQPTALVVLDEQLREAAPQTIGYFGEQGVAVKVISGDSPVTVGAVELAAEFLVLTTRSMPAPCQKTKKNSQTSLNLIQSSAASPRNKSERWCTRCSLVATSWR